MIFDGKILNFDTGDPQLMLDYMDDCKENPQKYRFPLFGKTDDDEDFTVEIYEDKIIVATTQKNNWIRKVWYWRDGTIEEMYDGSLVRQKMEEEMTVCPCCGQYIPPKLREKLKQQ